MKQPWGQKARVKKIENVFFYTLSISHRHSSFL